MADFTERRVPMNSDELHHLIEQYHGEAEKGHERLREDLDRIRERMENLESMRSTNESRFTRLESTPVDVKEIRFSTPVVASIVGVCLVIAGGLWSIDSRLRDIAVTQASQEELSKFSTKLQDERAVTTVKTFDVINEKLEQQRMKIESMSDAILKLQPR